MNIYSLTRSLTGQARRIGPLVVMCAGCLAILLAASAHGLCAPAKLATGNGHGVLLKADATLWAWGANGHGQLGNGGEDDASEPIQVPGLGAVKDVACGENFTVAVKDDGSVWAWGDNEYGELGNGTTNPLNKPAQVADMSGAAAVAAGRRHALILKADGTVWEWGGDSKGSRPKQVEKLADVVAVADGSGHSVALKADGTVWVWGDHGAGDLGNGSYNNAPVPMRLGDLSDVAAVAAGQQLTLALKRDGSVWAVGYGAAGGLGDGTVRNESTKPVMVSGLTGVKALAAGTLHVVALKGDGTVWSWGGNRESQLGSVKPDASGGKPEMSPKPLRSGSLTGVVAVAAGYDHSLALTDQGTVWGWGDNEHGALGTDSERLARADVPMKIGQPVPDKCESLFACQTKSGKVIQLCGRQDENDSSKWTGIQYRFGPENGPPELLFPKDPSKGEPALFFSHMEQKGEYRVSVRFAVGGITYRVYSTSRGKYEGSAGVTVTDAKGKQLANITCAERPEIFIDYLRTALPCDRQNPHGEAACRESPYREK